MTLAGPVGAVVAGMVTPVGTGVVAARPAKWRAPFEHAARPTAAAPTRKLRRDSMAGHASGPLVVCGTLLTSPLWAAVSPTPTQRPPPKRSAESWAGGARCWSAEDWAASCRPPVGAPKRAEV